MRYLISQGLLQPPIEVEIDGAPPWPTRWRSPSSSSDGVDQRALGLAARLSRRVDVERPAGPPRLRRLVDRIEDALMKQRLTLQDADEIDAIVGRVRELEEAKAIVVPAMLRRVRRLAGVASSLRAAHARVAAP